MGFHGILAYFTGYKYEPDPEVQPSEQGTGRPIHPEMTSIVETIVREKAEQEPEEQAATAEGNVTFSDLMQQYEEPDALEGPPALPSVLDAPGSFGPDSLFDTPQDRLVQDDSGLEQGEDDSGLEQGEDAAAESDEGATTESDAWLSEMGLMGQGDMSLERSLQGQPDGADRLGLDDMFGQGDDALPADDADMGGMFGDEPGYEDLVGEALGGSGDIGDVVPGEPEVLGDEGQPELFEEMEDLLPVDEEDIVPADTGDRGFTKSVLLADERMALAAAKKVLASDVTININVGESGEDDEVEGLEGFGEGEGFDEGEGLDEFGEGLDEVGGELDTGEGFGGEGPDLGELDEGDEELELGLGEEAESILRRVLANDVTININIGDGDEVDLDAPKDLFGEAKPEEESLDDFGEDLGDLDEEMDEDLGDEIEGLGEGLGAVPKKGDGESFDELDDLEDVFQSGDKNDEINEFGI